MRQLDQINFKLDRQIMQVYGFIDSDGILAKLLKLNLELT